MLGTRHPGRCGGSSIDMGRHKAGIVSTQNRWTVVSGYGTVWIAADAWRFRDSLGGRWMPDPRSDFEVSLLRPDDLLNLVVNGINLRLDDTDPDQPVLVVDDPGQPALLIVRFPAQT